MASRNPDLFQVLSEIDGRRPETFREMAYTLRRVEMLPETKRGRGANEVCATSAAMMLLAALPGVGPSKAPRAVAIYGTLKPKRRGGSGSYVPVLSAVASSDCFAEALMTLIEGAARLKADILKTLAVMFPDVSDELLLDLQAITLEISVTWPMPSARLVMKAIDDVGIPREVFTAEWVIDAHRMVAGQYREEVIAASADKNCISTISERSIFALSELLGQAELVAGHDEPVATTTEAA